MAVEEVLRVRVEGKQDVDALAASLEALKSKAGIAGPGATDALLLHPCYPIRRSSIAKKILWDAMT